ncbi:albumin-2-like [Vigna unguiculata]|uniref:Hemopexin-like repeat n=1 Tax=Vigna unguiculata TaxID=3917 RepID=A0A4D6MUB0_VIGUN|nr:albumin-2-like [Vigna unguiculata]QCE05066.1 Hemopexin-like repeat [Vigna unguiculata]
MSDPVYIDAALPSSNPFQVYFFIKNKYVRLYYTPGTSGDELLTPLELVSTGFPSLAGTPFAEQGIDGCFNTEGSEAYIFSGKNCAYIDYAPNTGNDKILQGPSTIAEMFPDLRNTVFAEGLDGAFRSTIGKEVYIFKGEKYTRITYDTKLRIIDILDIPEGFPVLKGTIFENGIDACFSSHVENEVYLFKGDDYVRMKVTPHATNDTLVGDVTPIVEGWPPLKGIVPVTE